MKLFLVRHGETDWLCEGRFQGYSEVALNDNGRKQARAAASFLKEHKPNQLFSSVLPRAEETACFIGQECGIPVQKDTRLNEIFFGEWEGKRQEEVEAEYPTIYRDWLFLNENFTPPGGESVMAVSQRVKSFFSEARHLSETIVAVSHGGPIRLLLLELLKAPLYFFRSIRVVPGGITLIESDHGSLEIVGAFTHKEVLLP